MTELSKTERKLYEVILALDSVELCSSFFRDLCTPAELKALRERWSVAILLDEGQLSYRQIHEETGVSIATITRVARFLFHENNSGYKRMLEKMKVEIEGVAESEGKLYRTLLALGSLELCSSFFRDLCTPAELKALRERWLVAALLDESKLSYRQIHEETGVSIATITRVARFLFHENNSGYKRMLETINK